jgi:hypothetical protein
MTVRRARNLRPAGGSSVPKGRIREMPDVPPPNGKHQKFLQEKAQQMTPADRTGVGPCRRTERARRRGRRAGHGYIRAVARYQYG